MGSIQEHDSDRLQNEVVYFRSTLQESLINSSGTSGYSGYFKRLRVNLFNLKREPGTEIDYRLEYVGCCSLNI